MRISDWSSDVCSADLMEAPPEGCRIVALARPNRTKELAAPGQADPFTLASLTIKETTDFVRRMLPKATQETLEARSEEHTSELQSLMRISYAVFCLKKKKKMNNTTLITSKENRYTTQSHCCNSYTVLTQHTLPIQ